MKRITLLIIPNLLMVFFSLSIHAQTLNESADWPNSDWVITGDYESDADAFEADPTLSGNFAFDDDDAGGNSEDEIAAESPVIDLTEAYNAGETWINFSADYFFRVVNSLESEQEDLLVIEYWDSENSIWVDWSGPIPGTQGSSGATTNDFCSPAKVACNVTKLNIENFSSTQLTGFKYRIRYDDDGQDSSGNGWEYGFCFDAPTIFSQVPPTCLVPTNLEVDNLTSTSADISWTAGDSETDWEVLYGGSGFDVETEGTMINDINGEPEVSISDLSESISYDVYVRAICDEEDTSDWVLLSFYTVPSNDECDNAIELVLNDNLECTLTTAGTTVSATGSDLGTDEESVTGTPNNDVWFTFTATSSIHPISLLNVEAVIGSSTDMGMALYDGTGGCEALALFDDSDPNSFTATGLTVGETYYLRVYGWASTNSAQATFDVCVKTPPPAPSNDECDNAIELVLNDDEECISTTAGTTVSATGTDDEEITGTPNNDVWFTFTATSSSHPISLSNVEAVMGSSIDMGMALYDGSGGCEALTLFDDSDPNSFTATGLTVGETYYLRVYGWASTNSAQTTFDVCVQTIQCIIPTNVVVNNITDTSVEISWTSNGDESEWEVFYGESGFDFETEGTSVIDDDDTLGEVLDELSPDTQYDVYIRSICGEDSESDWTSVLSFTTNANPVLVSVENPVLSETYCYGNNDFKQWLFQSENGEPLTITFTTGTVEANSSGGTFDDLIIYNGQDNSGDILFDSDLDGSDLEGLSFEASSGFIYMTLDADGSNNCAGNDQTTIDFDVFIEVCETPTNVTIDNITDTTAEVTWTDNAGVTEWEVLYGETGFDPTSEGESMMDNNDELGVILSDLTPETTYDVYVRAICDNDNMSEWTAVESFTTDFLGVNTENFVGFNYYPNPVKNSINLESRLNIDKVSIYNLLGQEVLSRDLNEMSPSLDMSNLASGAYILRVQIGSQSKIIRVIKE